MYLYHLYAVLLSKDQFHHGTKDSYLREKFAKAKPKSKAKVKVPLMVCS